MQHQTVAKSGKHAITMLAVYCGKSKSSQRDRLTHNRNNGITELGSEKICSINRTSKDLVTGGQLEVHVLETCSKDELKWRFQELQPDVVYFLGECFSGTDDIGPLQLADGQVTTEVMTTLFHERLPQLVCLETSAASKLAEALRKKGVPYVVFWKGILTVPWAVHFREAFISVLRSSSGQIWKALQLADASFRFHYSILNQRDTLQTSSKNSQLALVVLGDAPPNIVGPPNFKEPVEADGSSNMLLKVQIFEDEIDFPLLVLADLHGQDSEVLGSLEDGLNAVLAGEVAGMRLLHRVSAPPPSSGMPPPGRGVVTMRCDLCTSSSARISLLVAGSPQTCFDDQMLEYSIKKEILEKDRLVCSTVKNGEHIVADIRKSSSIACGVHVSEVKFRSSSWVVQILRQLSTDLSFRSLVALGIAGIQGFPVVPFFKEDTQRFLALRPSRENDADRNTVEYNAADYIPSWLTPPAPTVKRRRIHCHGSYYSDSMEDTYDSEFKKSTKANGVPACDFVAAMKPVPHVHPNRDISYVGSLLNGAWSTKANVPHSTGGRDRPSSFTGAIKSSGLSTGHKGQSIRVSSPAQMLSLNPIPMKKHSCSRPPMYECSEDEFKKDVMEFLISRGHGRLVPSQDVECFPDAVLNGKRLDLYNLYKEVVSRGGFHVGNGINWKGQVFSKMRNHTAVNKMTGVGNTLKKHYETFLLEYELAHDDVDGECCILCHSSAPGDWVNCGTCGEWAHFGCDRRNGLGAFKDYAKTDGLEYTCPRCSNNNSGRKKSKNPSNAFSRTLEPIPRMAKA